MSAQNPQKVSKKIISHSYVKLLPPLFFCLAMFIYAAVSLSQSDIFGIPLNSLTNRYRNSSASVSRNQSDDTTPNINSINLSSFIINNITTRNNANYTSFISSRITKQNISYNKISLPEYHLRPLSDDMWNANPLQNVAQNHKPRSINGNAHKVNNNNEYDQYISLLIQQSSAYKNTLWYKDFRKYRLQLHVVTLQNSKFITFPINKRFMLYPRLRTVEYLLCNAPGGYGNGLSVYWGVRSLAYWMNYNFKISCKGYQNKLLVDKNKLMSAFLPFSIASDANINRTLQNISLAINEDNTVITFMPSVDKGQHDVIHPTSLIFMYYNPYFQPIMNYETTKACMDYYNGIYDGMGRINAINQMMDTNDIVIHVRCGDVLQIMHRVKDWDYGFLSMNHYRYVMNIGLKRKFGIDWYDRITNKTTVWILSQLSHGSARKGEKAAMTDCDFLINYIVDNGFKDIFKPANIVIKYDSDVNDDFYRMLVAPLLFCSPSTYCLNAAIANMNGIVVMPNRGAWIDFFCIDKKNESYYVDLQHDFIIASDSHLLPKNQLVIDTEKAGWHVNKIDNYTFNKQSYKQSMYAHKLAEYLIAH